jgi:predicted small lipoprotein YifL
MKKILMMLLALLLVLTLAGCRVGVEPEGGT